MPFSESKQSMEIPKRNLSDLDENSVTSFQMEIFRRFYAHSTPFNTPNVAHANFRVETVPGNPKTQSFRFRRKLCYFVPHWDISAFKRSFYSILHAERNARRFPRRQNPCKSQNAIFEISTKTLRSFHYVLHAERCARQNQRRNNPCKSQNAIFQNSTKTLLFRSWLRYFGV
jgi:hypothetical protein